MEDKNEMTAQKSLEIIRKTMDNSRKEIVSQSGKYFIMWGCLLTLFSLIIYFLWKGSGNSAWNNLWFAMPVVGYAAGTIMNRCEKRVQPENFISKLLANIWAAFGAFAVSVSAFTVIYATINPNPLGTIAVGISLTAEIILLFGLAECISGFAVKNWAISAAGFITGIGGLAIYHCLGNNSEGIEQMFIFTFAGVVLALTGLIIKLQNR